TASNLLLPTHHHTTTPPHQHAYTPLPTHQHATDNTPTRHCQHTYTPTHHCLHATAAAHPDELDSCSDLDVSNTPPGYSVSATKATLQQPQPGQRHVSHQNKQKDF